MSPSKRSQDEGNSSQASLSKRIKLNETDTNLRPGKISKIHLKNFMCHSSLQVEFNPNINFVIGRNGSGKSAILTALIVVLGGKASDTNRSSSLKQFIKKGCQSTIIDIEIVNIGCLAYRPKEYGKTITISRQLYTSGRSQYKIKSEKGIIISTKRSQVVNITSCLKMMVDNPLCVLTQDTARTFLSSSEPKKLYTFFSKATSLETHKNSLLYIASVINNSDDKVDKMRDDTTGLEEEVKELQTQLERYKSMDDLQQSKKDLEIEMQWSQISKLEEDKLSAQSEVQKAQFEVDEIVQNIAEKDTVQKRLEEKIECLQSGLTEKQHETQKLQEAYRQLRAKDRAQKESYQEKNNEIKNLKKTLERTKEQMEVILQEIKTQEQQLSMWDKFKAERDEKIKALQGKEAELKDVRSVTEMDLSAYFGNKAKIQDDIERMNAKLRNTNGKINQTTSLIRQLDSQSNNALSLYGVHVPQLVDILKKAYDAGRFTALPKGPIGKYIEVRDKVWSGAIESILGSGFLNGFCVTNSKDKQTFVALFQSKFPNTRLPLLITSQFFDKLHDTSRNRAQSERRHDTTNFLDAIRLSDSVVANTVVDQHAVERVLLFDSEDTAIELLSVQDKVPRNCAKVVLKDGTVYYPKPNYRMYCGHNRPSRFLQISVKERQSQLSAELQQYQEEVSGIQAEIQEKERELDATLQEIASLKRKLDEYCNKSRQVQNRLAQLNDEEEPAQGNIDALREEYQVMKNKETDMAASVTELEEELAGLKCCLDEFTECISKAKAEARESENACMLLQEKLDDLERTRNNSVQGPALERRLQKAKKELGEREKQVTILENQITSLLSNMDEDQRPKCPRSPSALKELLQQVQSSIRSLMAQVVDPEKLQEEYEDKSKALKSKQKYLEAFQHALGELRTAANLRHKMYMKMRQHMSSQVQHYFMYMLNMRQYQGRLFLDHKEETLTIEVDPTGDQLSSVSQQNTPSTSKSSSGKQKGFRDLRSLSGGERSYSTVSFLIALWNCMNLPFYFLDEFDVFMDHMNRKVIMDVLLQSAHDNLHKQYVFLTPQDTSTIKASDTIKIHQLAAPER